MLSSTVINRVSERPRLSRQRQVSRQLVEVKKLGLFAESGEREKTAESYLERDRANK